MLLLAVCWADPPLLSWNGLPGFVSDLPWDYLLELHRRTLGDSSRVSLRLREVVLVLGSPCLCCIGARLAPCPRVCLRLRACFLISSVALALSSFVVSAHVWRSPRVCLRLREVFVGLGPRLHLLHRRTYSFFSRVSLRLQVASTLHFFHVCFQFCDLTCVRTPAVIL